MTRRLPIIFLAVAVLLAACSPSESSDTSLATTTSSTSTTTTTIPTTTTTTMVPVRIEGGPPGLIATIEEFYDYAAGRVKREPSAPPAVVAMIEPGDIKTPTRGSATVGKIQGKHIAVAKVGGDIFLAVKGRRWTIVGGEWPSLAIPAFFGRGPRVVAVVGSDARPGQTVEISRADSIHFVGLDGRGGGAIVGLPRDSWVEIPGFGNGKITTSLSLGGPETMMGAFTELTDLRFEGYVLTGFSGFEELLGSVLGGVTVDVPFSIDDRWAHVTLDAGEQLLDGAEALGFARARKTVPNGDLTRSEHQGLIMIGAARAVKEMGLEALPRLLELSEPHIITDLKPAALLTFSAMAVKAKLGTVDNVVAPGTPGSAGSASVVYLSDSVDELFADLADGVLETD